MEREENTLNPTETPEIVEGAESVATENAEALAPTGAAVLVEPKLHKKSFSQKIKFDKWKGWIYLLPCIVLIVAFTVWPIINTIRMAFINDYTPAMETNAALEQVWGVENFKFVLEDKMFFLPSLKNTLLLCVLTVPISTFLALLIAVCLNSIKPLQRIFQTIFFLPYVTNSIAIGMVFAAMFQMTGIAPDGTVTGSPGIINAILGWFGVEPINWMNGMANGGSSSYAANIAVMVVYIVWNALPFKILILLGGLQSVNKQYYEAAKIDSTPRWRVFWKITVPLLSPMLAYVIITGFIGGFKEYSSIIGVFGEYMGPTGSDYKLITMVGYIYQSLGDSSYGYASASALILFLIIFAVTMVNLHVSKKKTHY